MARKTYVKPHSAVIDGKTYCDISGLVSYLQDRYAMAVTANTVRRMAREGQLPSVIQKGSYWFELEAVMNHFVGSLKEFAAVKPQFEDDLADV